MSCEIKQYLQDGANFQARAVLMFLQGILPFIECYDRVMKKYHEIYVARWENCIEQGYVVYMINKKYTKQINIAFFEHRNCEIHAVKWIEKPTLNSPTIDTVNFGDIYKDKWDTTYKVKYGEIKEMAEWIYDELRGFWIKENE